MSIVISSIYGERKKPHQLLITRMILFSIEIKDVFKKFAN